MQSSDAPAERSPTAAEKPAPRTDADGPIEVLLVDDDQDFVTLASTLLETESERIETITETDPEAVVEGVDLDAVDCIVSDYRMPEMDGIEFLRAVRAQYPRLPFILFTGKGSETVAQEAMAAGVSDYIIKDGSPEQYAISANRIENLVANYRTQTRAREKQALDALSQAIVQTVLSEPTREGIERAVCEQLVGSDRYTVAWIGDRESHTEAITPRVWAGETAIRESVSFGAGDARSVEARALATGERQVETAFSDNDGPWYAELSAQGVTAAVGLPLIYEDVPYGVVGVYTHRAGGLAADELSALEQLAALTAFAIGASERRRGDTSRQIITVEFDVTATELPFVRIASLLGCAVELRQTTHRTDGTKATVYRLETEPVDQLGDVQSLLAAESVRIETESAAHTDLVVVSKTPWWDELTGLYGANIETATASETAATLRIELPPSADVRSVVDHITERYPGAEPTSRQASARSEQSVDRLRAVVGDQLTDRQREVIETAYQSGYYEWPHAVSSEAVAERLGIAQPTFAEHFWTAQRQIVGLLFDTEDEPNQ